MKINTQAGAIRPLKNEDEKMTDLVSRAALFNALSNVKTLEEAFAAIQNAQTADGVEVVRCKDCWRYNAEYRFCVLNDSDFMPDDFCSYGDQDEGK